MLLFVVRALTQPCRAVRCEAVRNPSAPARRPRPRAITRTHGRNARRRAAYLIRLNHRAPTCMISRLRRSCPRWWCRSAGSLQVSGGSGRLLSGGHGGQLDEGIVAQWCHGFQGHVAGALDGPLIVLFQEDGPDEPDDGLIIGEDADDLGAALDLAVD